MSRVFPADSSRFRSDGYPSAFPIFRSSLLHSFDRNGNPGIVDRNIQTPELLPDLIDHVSCI